jgi:hypothetical protein
MIATDYKPMWKNLGLSIEAHDTLLGVFGKAYQDIYLAQKDGPEGMEYLDFVMSEVHGLHIHELMDALVGRYFQVDCAIFTPNPNRLEGS